MLSSQPRFVGPYAGGTMHKDDCQHQAQNSRQRGDVDGSNQAKADNSQANNGYSEQHEPAYQPTHLGTSARRLASATTTNIPGDSKGALRLLQRSVIVAMIVVRMMQVAVNEIVDVIPVWHLLMPASRPMHVSWIMAAAMV
jgi:hypothetical protein